MKVLVIDVSSKVPHYDFPLSNAINKQSDVHVTFAAPIVDSSASYRNIKLFRIPINPTLSKSDNKLKKALRAFETLWNYIHILFVLIFSRYDVVHFQWLPFLEVSNIEKLFLKLYRLISKKTVFLFTIHCLFPHNCKNIESYKNRLNKVVHFFDGIIVHTNSYKVELINDFLIEENLISVIFGGVYIPEYKNIISNIPKTYAEKKFNILHFGGLSEYKGTDLVIEAINDLSAEDKEKIHATIAGAVSDSFYKKLLAKSVGLNIEWFPYMVSDEFLYDALANTDLIVLPYREVSFSGALLLSIYFEKPILTSDIPSFLETLDGYDEGWFFRSEDVQQFALRMSEHINHKIDTTSMIKTVQTIKEKYTWENSAKSTVTLYKDLFDR